MRLPRVDLFFPDLSSQRVEEQMPIRFWHIGAFLENYCIMFGFLALCLSFDRDVAEVLTIQCKLEPGKGGTGPFQRAPLAQIAPTQKLIRATLLKQLPHMSTRGITELLGCPL